jgi:hypothetical protein
VTTSSGKQGPHRLDQVAGVTSITGSDILMDGGVTAAYWYGELAEVRT